MQTFKLYFSDDWCMMLYHCHVMSWMLWVLLDTETHLSCIMNFLTCGKSQKKAVKLNLGKLLRKGYLNFFNAKNWPILLILNFSFILIQFYRLLRLNWCSQCFPLGTKVLEFGSFWAQLCPFSWKNKVIWPFTKQNNDFANIFYNNGHNSA